MAAARQEGTDALKTAVAADGDMCMLMGDDIRKYSEAARIAKLDDSELLKLPEEDRLVYALKIAGPPPSLTDDPRLMNSPLYRSLHDGGAMRNCKQVPDGRVKMDAAAIEALQASEDTEIARSDALKAWIADMQKRIGAGFDDKMRSAASHLGDAGYSARWPAEAQFYGEDQPGTFGQVQALLRARNGEDERHEADIVAQHDAFQAQREKNMTSFEQMQARIRERDGADR